MHANPPGPRLLVVAHGTTSATGSATTAQLVAAVSAARPSLSVDLCFLDVVGPRLADALDDSRVPTVVVPLLLSTGYHVLTDIPAVVAHRSDVRVAPHLGPDPLLVDALLDRLAAIRGDEPAASTVLVGAGSSRPEAALELAETAELLSARLGRPVSVRTMADDLPAAFGALPAPVEVATYLLADGAFVATLRAAADGIAAVADPIGVHPALVSLVLARYDATAG
jgi:sirohydrochlorin ferrochelatase